MAVVVFLIIILQLIIFSGLTFFLKKMMSKNIVSATKHLEGMSKDYEDKEKEVLAKLKEAKEKSRMIVIKANSEAEQFKDKTIKSAESERDSILKQARIQGEELIQQADKARRNLISEVENKIESETIKKACEIIENVLPEKFRLDVHSLWVKNLIDNDFIRLDNLRVPEDINEIKIISAFPLDNDQKDELSLKMKLFLDRGVIIKEEVDPKIIVGIIVFIGSFVLDGSLKNKIDENLKARKNRINR